LVYNDKTMWSNSPSQRVPLSTVTEVNEVSRVRGSFNSTGPAVVCVLA
jgi:hypothetical protein